MTLGICYMQLENYALSMKSFEQAKELFSLKEDEVNQAGVYNNLGILYRKEGDFDTAIQFFKESIFMYNNLNNSNQRNNVEIELAKTYFEKGGLEEARRVCLDVLELASINKYKYEAYICLGDIETENSNFSLAIEYYKNALAELGPNQENVYKKLLEKQAKVYHKLGDYERASSLLLDAVS
ncbi:tetratricopeptide repeat protein [Ornithinibacillus sp. FSL M8-0202]|uniref:tetratricopeptide repeat protein n=1 Tax=Ornithinibacillus sp. FSL M8-0202 TaxID=2921616 RepID=UPI0030D4A6BA